MRIAIVNDLPLAIEAIRRALATVPLYKIAWTARDGAEAVRRCAEDKPDLILMDLIMPVMNGVEATKKIMAATPCAILIVTATVDGAATRVFEALSAGALDAVNTPTLVGAEGAQGAAALVGKIEALRRLTLAVNRSAPKAREPSVPPPVRSSAPFPPPAPQNGDHWLFAIGASAGGPAALAQVLHAFPMHLAAAVVVIQHLDESFATAFAEWIGMKTPLRVRVMRDGDRPEPGVVYLPGRADHLVLTAHGTMAYRAEPVDDPYRPSVDVFFESAARHWRNPIAAVVLTGMGNDGARGMKLLRERGHPTIAQDRESCAVFGMPKAAIESGAAARVLPLSAIGLALVKLLPVSRSCRP